MAARVDLELAPIPLGTRAQAELDRARLLHPKAALTMSGPNVVAPVDAGQVSGILRNVIENALRAAGPQGQVHTVHPAVPKE